MSTEARQAFEQSISGKALTPAQRDLAWEIFYPRWICETRTQRDKAGEFDVKPFYRMS